MDIKILDESDERADVSLNGTITFKNSNELRVVLVDLSKKKIKKIRVDMKDVDYLDSSAIATFIECLKITRAYGGELVLRNLNETCKDIFMIARLDKIFTFE
ncbi:MAG: STAS domain-containing protein [Candidatus Ratteibacteria bacterium]|nr:STAS domain-containing protein [Candidatus Ratteibacteria bacterium]